MGKASSRTILIVLAAIAFSFAAWQAWSTTQRIKGAVHTMGSVAPDAPGDNDPVSAGHPFIEFRASDGRLVRFMQNGMGPTRIGTRVAILYRASDPKGTAIVPGLLAMWSLTIFPLIMGMAALGLALLGAELGSKPGRF